LVFCCAEKDPVFDEHVHDFNEMIGFFGSKPDDPYDLGAEIEIGINAALLSLSLSNH